MYRLLNKNFPEKTFKANSPIKYTQFMKIYAKACLRGAVENIYDYVQHLAKVEES